MKKSINFEHLEDALTTWSGSKSRSDIWPQVSAAINTLSKNLGEVSRIYIPESQSYIGVSFVSRPGVVGAYIGPNHIDHIVEIPGSSQRQDAPSYWRTMIGHADGIVPSAPIELPQWKPHKKAEERRASAHAVVRALLGARNGIEISHLKELLSIAVWKHTVCDGKYTTQFRSLGAITKPDEKLNHEHVVPRKLLVEAMLEDPSRAAEILESAIGCTVLEEEHKKIMKIEKSQVGLLGWDRYRAAEIEVYDLLSRERIV